MTTQDEAILEAAKAAHEAMRHSHALDGTSIPAWEDDDTQDFWIEVTGAAIRAYLSELEKAGFAVTQAEATDHMAAVAMNAWTDLEHMKDQRERMRHAVSQGIAASPKPPGADL